MFKKEGSASTSTGKASSSIKETPLRKSDIRRLRDRFLENHTEDLDSKTLEMINDAFGRGSTNEMIVRRKLRINDENIVIYSRLPSSDPTATSWPYNRKNQALVLEMEDLRNQKVLIPCLSLLSIVPNYLPNVLIGSETSKYICRGADLMRGGVMKLPPGGKQGAIVSISVYRNYQPFAVGILMADVNQMDIGYGNKGMAVRILLCYGDDLWKQQSLDKKTTVTSNIKQINVDNGHYNNPGFINGEKVFPLSSEEDEEEDVQKDDKDEIHDETQSGDIVRTDDTQQPSNDEDISNHDTINQNHTPDTEGNDTQLGEQQNSGTRSDEIPSEQDIQESLLLNCFYKAIIMPSEPIKLPIPVSVFYAKHILSARPSESVLINLKKTKYKKIGSFLQDQAKTGIINVQPSKDKKDKVAFLSQINKSHPIFRQVKKDLLSQSQKSPDNDLNTTANNSSNQRKLTIVNLYCVPSHFVSLLRLNKNDVKASNAKSTARKGTGYLTNSECRELLDSYITTENLVVAYDHAEVTLDGPLCDALFKKSKKEVEMHGNSMISGGYPTQVTRKDLMEKWMGKMEKAHAIVMMPGNEIISMKRGEPSKILITVSRGTGGGNRFVTRVRGLEEYNINCEEFSKDVSKRFALSGTIDSEPKKSAALKKGCAEVVFGGHILEELIALLTANEKLTSHGGAKNSPYNVPKGAIDYKLGKGVTKKKLK